MRIQTMFELSKFLLSNDYYLFGGFPRDLIRYQAGIIDEDAFNDIDCIIEACTDGELLVKIWRLSGIYSRDPRFNSDNIEKMPSKSSYAGYTMTIVCNAGFRGLTYEIKIDFVRKLIDNVLDFDIGTIIMTDDNTFAIRPCKVDNKLEFGKVMQNILTSKFKIIGLAPDASFKVLNGTGIEQLYNLIRMIKMCIRTTKKMDQGYDAEPNSIPDEIFKHIRRAKKQCYGCFDNPDQCVYCDEIGDTLEGKWCYTLQCCDKLITLECLYKFISSHIYWYQSNGLRKVTIVLDCPSCKKDCGL